MLPRISRKTNCSFSFMTESLLNAPADLSRVLQGISLLGQEPEVLNADSVREDHHRAFIASEFIYACADDDSNNWSNYFLSSAAEQSSLVSDVSNAPRMSISEDDAGNELLLDTIHGVFPVSYDLCARPSNQLSTGVDVWHCPVEHCREIIRPFNLNQQQYDVVLTLSDSFDTMLARGNDNRVRLRRQDPFKFLRYVDAIAWEHIAWHLHRIHISFYYPHPHLPYKERPGWWWNEALLVRDQPLLQQVRDHENTSRQNRRHWLAMEAVNSARRRIQRGRARLTRWRYNALQARRDLISDMFRLNRGIVEVGRSLLHLVRQQEADPRTQLYSEEIAYYRDVELEWGPQQFL
ncbi:unnamed protein product [Peniophora sp. CBMAI 1063]|nr:unnamed protein product [Peniophora sp. CBMAI 1063]